MQCGLGTGFCPNQSCRLLPSAAWLSPPHWVPCITQADRAILRVRHTQTGQNLWYGHVAPPNHQESAKCNLTGCRGRRDPAIDRRQWSPFQTNPSEGGLSPRPDHVTSLHWSHFILHHLKFLYCLCPHSRLLETRNLTFSFHLKARRA